MKTTYNKQPATYASNFSKAAWIIRIITMSIALGSIIYYLNLYNRGELAFQKKKTEWQQSDRSVIRMKIPVGRSKD